jgi:putative toxin-antitoxin system antitoxin component (TIGR02293 family)
MTTTTTTRRRTKKEEKARDLLIAMFWSFSANRGFLNESERLLQISEGLPAQLFQALCANFVLQESSLEMLFNISTSTLKRHRRQQKPLDPVASGRLDRIAAVCHLAEEVCDSSQAATDWMSKPNQALGGSKPIMLCKTERGAVQVSRVLQAIKWGGVV